MSKNFWYNKPLSPEQKLAATLSQLRSSFSNVNSQITSFRDGLGDEFNADSLERLVTNTERTLQDIGEYVVTGIGKFTDTRHHKFIGYRNLQYEHGAKRPAKIVDPLDTLIVAMFAMLLEGGATAVMMISEGKMTTLEGLGYGLIFAFINISTGIIGGFFPGRYMFYKIRSPEPTPAHGWIRLVSVIGFLGFLALLVLQIFSAARIRALGSHEGIFEFHEVSLWATFNDGIAIVIIIIGLLSSILAIWKGMVGLSDFIPGYSEARREAEESVDEAVDETVLDGIETLEDRSEDMISSLEDSKAEVTRAADENPKRGRLILGFIDRHNNEVLRLRDALKNEIAKDCAIKAKITGQPCPCEPHIDDSEFDTLLIEAPEFITPDKEASNQALEKLQTLTERVITATDAAISQVRGSHVQYLNSAPTLELFPEIGGFSND